MKTAMVKVIIREDGTMCVKDFDDTNLFGSDDVSDVVEEVRNRIYEAFRKLPVKE